MSLDTDSEKRIPLVLISGFLGSGKTTFLNNLFDDFPDSRFGIIVNDFGELGVDAAEIKPVPGSMISELNNGQIFCSCLSSSFIKSVSAYADKDIDYLLVEASGLAKPSPMMEIITAIKKLTDDRFAYYGMISLVDAGTYLELSTVLKAVDEQIAYSDLVLLNKVDTADAKKIKKSEMKILSVNPNAEIVRTEYGKIDRQLFMSLEEIAELPGPDRQYAGWGDAGRPVPMLLKSDGPVSAAALEKFAEQSGDDYFRLKGRIETDRGMMFVDCTVNSRKITPSGRTTGTAGTDKGSDSSGLVIILPADDNIIEQVKARASEIFTSVA